MRNGLWTRLFVVCLLFFIGSFIWRNQGVSATTITANSIGKVYSETENGKAVVGIQIFINGKRLSHAYDVWQYNAATGWQFQYVNVEGVEKTNHYATGLGKYLAALTPQGSNNRFLMTTIKMKTVMPETYKIETIRYQMGKEISREYEYSDGGILQCVSPEYSIKWMLLQNTGLAYGGCNPQEISCEYYIYSGLRLGTEVKLDLDGGTLIKEGVAYNNSRSYLVEALPVVTKEQDKYSYEFLGWYTQKSGGDKVEIGSKVCSGDALYAHWKKEPVKYEVKCTDVLKSNPNIVLGETTWEAEYGDVVSGGALGTSSDAGKYYQGRTYLDSSTAKVGLNGAQVYRYFENADMTVFCIDLVKTGPDAGTMLGTNILEYPYTSVVSGGMIGCKMELGAYYSGYQYVTATTQRVEENGCTIYRYFTPVSYDIHFVSNCASGGSMAAIRNCYYGHTYRLTKNSFINKSRIILDCNAKEATCDTSYQYVYQEFAGWSESPNGEVMYSDQCDVANLCDKALTKKLYAIWSDREVNITAVPKRLGYEFAGWSHNPKASVGKKQFQISGDDILYAVWKPAPVNYYIQQYKQTKNQSFELAAEYKFSAYTGENIVLDNMEHVYQGYWLDADSSDLQGEVKADGSLILSAYYRRGDYTVSFDVNGGTVISGRQNLKDIHGLYEEEVVAPEVSLQKQGYDFAGWGMKPDTDRVVAKSGECFMIPNHNQVLYAVWTPKSNTSFSVVPYYENTIGTGYIRGDEMILHGHTDSSIMDGICTYYNLGIDESIERMFGKGYQLFSKEGLESRKIAPDGTTSVDLYLRRERYQFVIGRQEDGGIHSVEEVLLYGQIYCFPKSNEDLGMDKIDYYKGSQGEIYYPGDIIQVTKDACFYAVFQKGLPESTQKPENTQKPFVSATPNESKKPIDSPSPEIVPQVSLNPAGSMIPEESNSPKQSEAPAEENFKNNINNIENGITTTPNAEDISALLQENKAKLLPAKGKIVTKANLMYKVTHSTLNKKTVKVSRMKKQTVKVVIPSTIRINGFSYRVTEIGKKAFLNQKKLRKVVLGNNIQKIGEKAFAGSKKLKNVIVKSKNMKAIGKDVWKGIGVHCQFRYSADCSSRVRKIFKKTY